MSVSYIPLGQPFLKTLVQGLLDRTRAAPDTLMDIELILPTRRACREIVDIFLDANDGRPLLLPKLHAVADIDDQELDMWIAAVTGHSAAIPPSISTMEREMVLADMVRAQDPSIDYAQALGLAGALGQLLDQIQDEGVSLDALDHLVPDEFAQHWQLVLNFLDVLRRVWPDYLAASGLMDPTARRARLIGALANHWREHPPTHPIIMAGVTGSLPYVADLMASLAPLDNVQIILGGFDPNISPETIEHMDDQHPHHDVISVLAHMNVALSDVRQWPYAPDMADDTRAWLWRCVMAPSALAPQWVDVPRDIDPMIQRDVAGVLDSIRVIECATQHEEASVVALRMRQILEHPHETVHVVTPDRSLATRIVAACARYGIEVNDSAGQTALSTPQGTFIILLHKICTQGIHPVDLISLWRHPLFDTTHMSACAIDEIDEKGLRGVAPGPTVRDYMDHLARRGITSATCAALAGFFDILSPMFDPGYGAKNLPDRLLTFLHVAEQLAVRDNNEASLLWQDEAGEVITRLFQTLLDPTTILPDIAPIDDHDFLIHMIDQHMVNRRGVGHPRVALLGVFESRLIAADHVILAGFNEGNFPRDQRADPWMSRAMRDKFGLPSDDVHVGRMALDILNLVSQGNVTITRAQTERGAATVPSRWLQRFDTFLQAISMAPEDVRDHVILKWVRDMDRENKRDIRGERPAPRPPVHLRPRTISATQFETLMRDPYAFYARKILRLAPLDPYDAPPDGRMRGIIIHRVLEQFVRAYPDHVPSNAEEKIAALLDQEILSMGLSSLVRAMIRPRLYRALCLYLVGERTWRGEKTTAIAFESSWEMPVDINGTEYKITARLDRVDQYRDGTYAILDYKTASVLDTRKDVEMGCSPQLPIEMALVERGRPVAHELSSGTVSTAGFVQVAARGSNWLMWSDRDEAKNTLNYWRDHVYDGLGGVLRVFHDVETPYYSLPDPARAPKYNDYKHLARVDEWASTDQDGAV